MSKKSEIMQLAEMQRNQNYVAMAKDLVSNPIVAMVAGVILINGLYQYTSREDTRYDEYGKPEKYLHTPIYSEAVRTLMQTAAIGYPAIAGATQAANALAPLLPYGLTLAAGAAGGAGAAGVARIASSAAATKSPLSLPAYGAPKISTWSRFLSWLKSPFKANVFPVYMTKKQIDDFTKRYGRPDYYET